MTLSFPSRSLPTLTLIFGLLLLLLPSTFSFSFSFFYLLRSSGYVDNPEQVQSWIRARMDKRDNKTCAFYDVTVGAFHSCFGRTSELELELDLGPWTWNDFDEFFETVNQCLVLSVSVSCGAL
ncbi:hypothetical protein F5050DRAFT_240536 [Lentinula boryana]|uniref:Uncharacterized protein n=1 Tax=Lentinula boryana TaxID=40481 RepID=A0ABQ8QR56_9AGAR|nr:hypothetical protein F5050DRAFT_240536 [Lentinula boryana]